MAWQVPQYIFYPISPLPCFSNMQVFCLLDKHDKELKELKETRAIAVKKPKEGE